MYRYGLKLWSSNSNYIDEAKKRGLDDGRCARVKGWAHLSKGDSLKAAGDTAGANF